MNTIMIDLLPFRTHRAYGLAWDIIDELGRWLSENIGGEYDARVRFDSMFFREYFLDGEQFEGGLTWLQHRADKESAIGKATWFLEEAKWSMKITYIIDNTFEAPKQNEQHFIEINILDQYKAIEFKLCTPWLA